MAKYSYTINDALEIYAFFEGQEEPFIYQPHNPSGEAWADDAEAIAWADDLISNLEASLEEAPAEEVPAE